MFFIQNNIHAYLLVSHVNFERQHVSQINLLRQHGSQHIYYVVNFKHTFNILLKSSFKFLVQSVGQLVSLEVFTNGQSQIFSNFIAI